MALSTAAADGPTSDRPKTMSGKFTNILIAFTVTTLPMVLLPAILLHLVFAYRLTQNVTASLDLQTSTDVEQSTSTAYYVNFSSTTFVFIASLMSTLASTLVASLMVLYSYPIVSKIVKNSENDGSADLPTPFQLGLLVQLSKGGLGSVWSWAKYSFGWNGKRAKMAGEVSWTGAFLVIAIGLSLLISVADTWLHLATKSVQYSQVVVNAQQRQAYGRRLSDGCTQWYISNISQEACTAGGGVILDLPRVFDTFYNLSSDNLITTFNDSGQVYAIVTESNPSPDVDFTASTFALSSHCELISQDCNLTEVARVDIPYNCKKINFAGNLGNVDTPFNFNFFNGSDGRYNTTLPTAINPFYWALASMTPGVYGNFNDSNILGSDNGIGSILWCNTTVYDVTYSQVNGSITKLVSSPSNSTLGGIFREPLELGFGYWLPTLKNGMQLAALSSNASQQLLDIFVPVFSRTAASFGVPATSSRQNIVDQTRSSFIAARVPKAPFYMTVVLGLLYALLGIALTVAALCITRDGVQDTVVKLGIEGLVAEGFERPRLGKPAEKVEELFEEWDGKGSGRVGIRKTELGHWTFTSSSKA